jgi:amino acid permease
LTGVFAYDKIEDLYTLNFVPNRPGDSMDNSNVFSLMIQYFLSLFPVFTLSTNFPIIAITLRNNLKSLFDVVDEEDEDLDDSNGANGYLVRRRRNNPTQFCKFLANLGFPLLAILPPFMVAIFVENVQVLVSITGSYAGAMIQYIIPIFLVFHARKRYYSAGNPYSSPFKHVAWLWFVLLWAIVSISFVTINYFIDSEPPL